MKIWKNYVIFEWSHYPKELEEVKNFWLDSTKGIKPNKKQEPVVFIVVCPKKMEWDFASEKQLQTTLLQTSGGITGTVERLIDNDKVEVEIADNVKVEIVKATGIQGLLNNQEVKK